MANRIRIGIVAPAPLAERPGTDQAAVERMVAHWRKMIGKVLPDCPDLIVVPEACDRYAGFLQDQARKFNEVRGQQIHDAFAEIAADAGCYLTYPAHRIDAYGDRRNSVVLFGRDGHVVGTYDKNHLTFPELEAGIVPGQEATVFDCDFGRVACCICFDLNFDEFRMEVARQRPDLVIFASMYHGGLMQSVWAYSSRSHFVAAVAGLPSAVLDPTGRVLASTTNYHPCVTTEVNLDCRLVHLDHHGQKIRDLKHRYGRDVTVFDPGLLGSVRITSEHDDIPVEQMLAEFEIEVLDSYLDRTRKAKRIAENMKETSQ